MCSDGKLKNLQNTDQFDFWAFVIDKKKRKNCAIVFKKSRSFHFLNKIIFLYKIIF